MVQFALDMSPVHQVLLEESVLGWKEYELEVVRDAKDNCVIICSIENLDPMGVHTGDSITVAPAMTLTDKEYQRMRDASIAIMREIGVTTGGSNVQFAVDPATGRQLVIEMNPRVSRSSALASKATGFPIAKIAAKLAIGYTLDELKNDITRTTPASFEPTIDYVVVKWPRFAFEKFPAARTTLGPQMKSVGEAMAIGRTFREALGKAIRSLETGRAGFDAPLGALADDLPGLERAMAVPGPERLFQLARGFQLGLSLERAHELTRIDPWFLRQIHAMAMDELAIAGAGGLAAIAPAELRRYKRGGVSDRRIAALTGARETEVRAARMAAGVVPVYKRVDTCAAEFEAHTPYFYSAYEDECEAAPTDARKVIILGGGPNRIGQGIEFDYCCVHASMALEELGLESIMINCNPETVSTDYDTSDRLYFEPLTLEDVLAICDRERPWGVIVQFGGQTPLKLAVALTEAGVPILGTSADAIDRAEDRERFGAVLDKLALRAPRWGIAHTLDQARAEAARIGYPVMIRPSYVLGGRAMERVFDATALEDYFLRNRLTGADGTAAQISFPLLVDQFLHDAVELDVDVVADAPARWWSGGVMEHIEEAGIHSGDSACALPPYSLPPAIIDEVKRQARVLAIELGVIGLMNTQFAVHDGLVYVLEVNPRASRTVPFVSKAIGVPLAKVAAKVMAGKTLAELGRRRDRARPRVGQGVGVPVREVRGGRHHPRPRDAVDRRGHGAGPDVRRGLPQGPGRRRGQAADRRRGVPVGARLRQGRGGRAGRRADRAGLRDHRHPRHRQVAGRGRHRGARGQQGARGAAALRRRDGQPRDRLRRQHHRGGPGHPRLAVAAPWRAAQRHRVLHDHPRRPGRAGGDRALAPGQLAGVCPPGVPRIARGRAPRGPVKPWLTSTR
jgi:carbamoyl-phosphate synthase large subunit